MADWFVPLALALSLLLPIMATWLFQSRVAHRIPNGVLRMASIGGFYLLALVGFGWGSLTMLPDIFDLGDLYPTTTHPIDDAYYFTQQEYGFVTIMSQGFNLTLYRQRPYWLDQKLGKVQLECSGQELVRATIVPTKDKRIHLRITADNQERLDTMLRVAAPFNFRRTFEDRTLNFSDAP